MRKLQTLTPRVRLCRVTQWLKALLDPRCELTLLVCRYFNRKGIFGAGPRVLNEQMLTFVEHGILLARIGGQDLRLTAGTAVWIPPGVSQQYCGAAGAAGVRQHNLRFQLHCARGQLAFRRAPLLIRNAWEAQPLLQMIGTLAEEGADDSAEFQPLRLRGLILSLAAALLSRAEGRMQAERTLRPAQRQRLAQRVAAHSGRRLSPADLAEEVQLSPDYFARVFRATYGQPPRTWLKAERMRLAAIRVRESDAGIKQIAAEFGFRELVLFYRQFRQVLGCTPGEYRRREIQTPVTR